MGMTQVLSVSGISLHMKPIIVTGNTLKDFPCDKKSAHIKAIFPKPYEANKMPKLGIYFGVKQWMRSYAIREFDPQSMQLTLDFAVNEHQSLASNWASNAVLGDHLGIAGPGDSKHSDL